MLNIVSLGSFAAGWGVKKQVVSQAAHTNARMMLKPALKADSVQFSTLKSTRFAGVLDKNHAVTFPLEVNLDLDQSAQLQQALLLRSIEKHGLNDNSRTTLYLDMDPPLNFPAALNGFADAVVMSDTEVDTVIKAFADFHALKPMMMTKGKRLMYPRATMQIGPMEGGYMGPMKDSKAFIRLFNQSRRDLEWLIMDRAGVRSRTKVAADLDSARELSALQCLAYGRRGLVDAILIGPQHVLPRNVLNKYFKANSLNGKNNQDARETFVARYDSLDKVVAWAKREKLLPKLTDFSPESVTENPTPIHQSVLDEDFDEEMDLSEVGAKSDKGAEVSDSDKAAQLLKQLESLIAKLKGEISPGEEVREDSADDEDEGEEEAKPVFHGFMGTEMDDTQLRRQLTIVSSSDPGLIAEVENVPPSIRSTYARDSVYFASPFELDSTRELEQALLTLFEKKTKLKEQGNKVSNILVVENSPGGYALSAEQLKSVFEMGEVPVDVLVQGWGCSAGSMMVSFATGNRFATPNSKILLHETRGEDVTNLKHANESLKGMEYHDSGYKLLIHQRTGRPLPEVEEDFKLNFEVNAVEALVYGPKGLVDAVLVGPDKVVMRDAVMEYLAEVKGSMKKAEAYVEETFLNRRTAKDTSSLENHKELSDDPLANPLALIKELESRDKVIAMSDVKKFRRSLPDTPGNPDKTLEIYNAVSSSF